MSVLVSTHSLPSRHGGKYLDSDHVFASESARAQTQKTVFSSVRDAAEKVGTFTLTYGGEWKRFRRFKAGDRGPARRHSALKAVSLRVK